MRGSEVNVWQDPDDIRGRHSRAYKSLQGDRAQEMASRLGLKDASKAPECLSCHSDAAPRRGDRFQVSDGVTCEACHGGAETWISGHYAPKATHAANLALGLYPTHDPVARVRLCATCHIGATNKDQLATHAIMAAGHPRLVLETELFTSLQSHHFEDSDYLARKPPASRARTWAIGQAVSMETAVSLFVENEAARSGLFPEPAFFDCRSCHRPISEADPAGALGPLNPFRHSKPGDIAFNDAYLITLLAAAKSFAPAEADRLEASAIAFHESLKGPIPERRRATASLLMRLEALSSAFDERAFTSSAIKGALRRIVASDSGARLTSYAGAEQAVMAIDSLSRALVDTGGLPQTSLEALRPALAAAYRDLEDPNAYRQADFSRRLDEIAAVLDLR
jgi:hypothetical protein